MTGRREPGLEWLQGLRLLEGGRRGQPEGVWLVQGLQQLGLQARIELIAIYKSTRGSSYASGTTLGSPVRLLALGSGSPVS